MPRTVLVMSQLAWTREVLCSTLQELPDVRAVGVPLDARPVALDYVAPSLIVVDMHGHWRWDDLDGLHVHRLTDAAPVLLLAPWMTCPPQHTWPERCFVLERPLDLDEFLGKACRIIEAFVAGTLGGNRWHEWAAQIRSHQQSLTERDARHPAFREATGETAPRSSTRAEKGRRWLSRRRGGPRPVRHVRRIPRAPLTSRALKFSLRQS